MKKTKKVFLILVLLLVIASVVAGLYLYRYRPRDIVVPELGIILRVPHYIDDFKYLVSGEGLLFSRTSLEGVSPLCGVRVASFGVIHIIKKASLSIDGEDIWYFTKKGLEAAVGEGLAKDLGDSYLVYVKPQDASCTTVVADPWGFDLKYLIANAELLSD